MHKQLGDKMTMWILATFMMMNWELLHCLIAYTRWHVILVLLGN